MTDLGKWMISHIADDLALEAGPLLDYRWLYLDRLEGEPNRIREFWLANREHGEPGLYTSAELAEGTTVTEGRQLAVDAFASTSATV